MTLNGLDIYCTSKSIGQGLKPISNNNKKLSGSGLKPISNNNKNYLVLD